MARQTFRGTNIKKVEPTEEKLLYYIYIRFACAVSMDQPNLIRCDHVSLMYIMSRIIGD